MQELEFRNLNLPGNYSMLCSNLDSNLVLLKLTIYANPLGDQLNYRFKFSRSGEGSKSQHF